ncbi:MAG: hypothetical protein A2Z20_01590 [Bdellovibrionales bacterium RBG_16_40_8]|nr:MAG: hypothetical protein A2Z20_01590 [Bdellovibrionales bacterium RBG_16_40_8]
MKTKDVCNIVLIVALSLFGSTLVTGCGASIKKADVAKTANPIEEIAELESGVSEGYANHYDVLAEKDFSQSLKYLDKANESLNKNRGQEAVLEDIAYAKAYLKRARVTSENRQPKAQGVLDSRKDAIVAGARKLPELKDKLHKLDSELSHNADDLDKDLSPKEFSSLQRGYQDLELAAIQTIQVGKTRAMVTGAKDDGAKQNVPKTLKTAEFNLKNAENTILSNRHDPDVYLPVVAKANESAGFLIDVLAATKRKGSNLDEADAVKLVRQTYEIRRLKGKVGEAQTAMNEMDISMSEKNRQLSQANLAADIQGALENARTQFSADEAEVYQQGDKLLIRLKSMAFPSGRADIPAASLGILAKVKTVADTLKPLEIIVEGHTDATGDARINQKLSEKRAAAVAEYFQTSGVKSEKIDSVGYGFKKPIATNKSAEGRAQNRRVDIIITPDAALE